MSQQLLHQIIQAKTLQHLHSSLQEFINYVANQPHNQDLQLFLPSAFKALANHALNFYSQSSYEFSDTILKQLIKIDSYLSQQAIKDPFKKQIWARSKMHLLNVQICMLRRNQNIDQAIKLQKETIEIQKLLKNQEDFYELGILKLNISALLSSHQRHDEAIKDAFQAVQYLEQVYFSQQKPNLNLLLHMSQSYYNLAIEKTYLQNFEEASSFQRKFENFILEKLGNQHPLIEKNKKLKQFIKSSQKSYTQDVSVEITHSTPNKFRKTPSQQRTQSKTQMVMVEQKVNNFFKPQGKSIERSREQQLKPQTQIQTQKEQQVKKDQLVQIRQKPINKMRKIQQTSAMKKLEDYLFEQKDKQKNQQKEHLGPFVKKELYFHEKVIKQEEENIIKKYKYYQEFFKNYELIEDGTKKEIQNRKILEEEEDKMNQEKLKEFLIQNEEIEKDNIQTTKKTYQEESAVINETLKLLERDTELGRELNRKMQEFQINEKQLEEQKKSIQLTLKKSQDQLKFLSKNNALKKERVNAAIKIQTNWKGYSSRKKYSQRNCRVYYLNYKQTSRIVKLQQMWKKLLKKEVDGIWLLKNEKRQIECMNELIYQGISKNQHYLIVDKSKRNCIVNCLYKDFKLMFRIFDRRNLHKNVPDDIPIMQKYFECQVQINKEQWLDLRSDEVERQALKDIACQLILKILILFKEEDLSYRLFIPQGSEIELDIATQRNQVKGSVDNKNVVQFSYEKYEDKEFLKKEQNTIRIQKYWKGKLEREQYSRKKIEEHKDFLVIQKWKMEYTKSQKYCYIGYINMPKHLICLYFQIFKDKKKYCFSHSARLNKIVDYLGDYQINKETYTKILSDFCVFFLQNIKIDFDQVSYKINKQFIKVYTLQHSEYKYSTQFQISYIEQKYNMFQINEELLINYCISNSISIKSQFELYTNWKLVIPQQHYLVVDKCDSICQEVYKTRFNKQEILLQLAISNHTIYVNISILNHSKLIILGQNHQIYPKHKQSIYYYQLNKGEYKQLAEEINSNLFNEKHGIIMNRVSFDPKNSKLIYLSSQLDQTYVIHIQRLVRGFLKRRFLQKYDRTTYYLLYVKKEIINNAMMIISIHRQLVRKNKDDTATILFVQSFSKFKASLSIPIILCDQIIKTNQPLNYIQILIKSQQIKILNQQLNELYEIQGKYDFILKKEKKHSEPTIEDQLDIIENDEQQSLSNNPELEQTDDEYYCMDEYDDTLEKKLQIYFDIDVKFREVKEFEFFFKETNYKLKIFKIQNQLKLVIIDQKFILLPTMISIKEENRLNLEEYIEDQLIINAGQVLQNHEICYQLIAFFKEEDKLVKKVQSIYYRRYYLRKYDVCIKNSDLKGQVHLGVCKQKVYVLIITNDTQQRQFYIYNTQYLKFRKNIYENVICKLQYAPQLGLHLIRDEIQYTKKGNSIRFQFRYLVQVYQQQEWKYSRIKFIEALINVNKERILVEGDFEGSQRIVPLEQIDLEFNQLREYSSRVLDYLQAYVFLKNNRYVLEIYGWEQISSMIKIKQKLMEEKLIKKIRIYMEVYIEEFRKYERKEVLVQLYKYGVSIKIKVIVKMEEDWIETDEYQLMICNDELRQKIKRNLNLIMNLMLEYDKISQRVVILDKEDLLSYVHSMPSRFNYL